MDYFPLVSILIIYFAVAFLKPALQPKVPFNICSICVAVSLSWLILLIGWFYDDSVSLLSIGILMGMSVAGIMYKSEDLYKKLEIRNFWFVRLVIIMGGFYGIMLILDQNWFVFSFVLILSFFLIVLATFLFQGTTHAQAMKEVQGKKSLIQKLEDCC